MLIDDSASTNFLNEVILRDLDCAEHIDQCRNGIEALNYLQTSIEGVYPQPDIIFLDINMPKMNGWEFLGEYENLSPDFRGKILMVMLTSSANPDDKELANSTDTVHCFLNKPLTEEGVKGVLFDYFGWTE